MTIDLHHDRLYTLAPMLQPKAKTFLAMLQGEGYRILVVRGWESPAAQFLKYQQGREFNRTSGEWEVADQRRVVTNAKPGESAHNIITADQEEPAAMALDIIPLDLSGKPLWETAGESELRLNARWTAATGRSAEEGWRHIYAYAARCGLDALGDRWGKFVQWDKGHFEEPAYHLILAELGLKKPTFSMLDHI